MEVSFAHDEDVVEACAPDTAEQSFADRVRAWCLDRRSEHLDPGSDCDSLEVRPVLRIVVTNQILRDFPKGHRIAELLRDPLVTWHARHVNVDDTPRGKLDDEEGEERLEHEVMDLEKVARQEALRVVPEERRPGLPVGSRWLRLPHVPLNGPLGDLDADLQQSALNTFSTSQVVVRCHLLDQPERFG